MLDYMYLVAFLQLKNIGRKYKKQAEDTQKEVEVMKKQQEETLKVRHCR